MAGWTDRAKNVRAFAYQRDTIHPIAGDNLLLLLCVAHAAAVAVAAVANRFIRNL